MWIAICVYVLVAIVRKELKLELSLSQNPGKPYALTCLNKCLWLSWLCKPYHQVNHSILPTN